MSDYDLINGEILTVSVTVDEEVITAEINTAARGPAGPAGSGTSSVTIATTSDGTAALYLDSIRFEATNGGPTQLGEMAWESTDGSIDAMLESGVIVAMGEDLVIRVRNTTASPITKGTALAYDGTSGASGRIEVKPWVGANIPTAKLFLGFAACDIPANNNGYSQWFGKLAEINTSGGAQTWLDEQIIYAVPGASATLTNIAPTSGEYAAAAVVINAGSGTSGILFVRPTFESITSLISLGAGTTGAELFGAANMEAARSTLGTIRRVTTTDYTSSSTTLTAAPELTFPVVAGKTYQVDLALVVSSLVAVGGVQVAMSYPAISRTGTGFGQTQLSQTVKFPNLGASSVNLNTNTTGVPNGTTGLIGWLHLRPTSSGNVTFAAGQFSAGTGTVGLLTGSIITVTEL